MEGEDFTTMMIASMDYMYSKKDMPEMFMNDMPEAKWLSNFTRVITPSNHVEVLELQVESHGWEEFERGLVRSILLQ